MKVSSSDVALVAPRIDTARAGVLDTARARQVRHRRRRRRSLPPHPPDAAARPPELLEGLVLACAPARFPIRDENLAGLHDVVRGRLPQQFTTETFSPATGMELMREAWTEQVKTDPRVRYTDILACRGFDGGPLLDRIRTPTLVIAGADDQVTPVALVEELARGIRNARLEVIPAAGHQAPLEQADRFNRLVADFAAALP